VSDIDLYRAEAERIRRGENYYDAKKAELIARGYPTKSVLNWRTPLPVWLVGVLPNGVAQALIAAAAIAVLCLAGHAVAKQAGLRRSMAILLLLIGGLFPVALAGPYIMPEVWCGVLLALSVCCFGIERRGAAVIVGIAALFVRELAAPYCAVCTVMAVKERQWKEVAAWITGGAAYTAFYLWHLTEVLPLIDSHARAHAEGWLQFGGAAFVISLVQMNVFLLLLPQWLSALYLVVAMLGFAGMQNAWGKRAAWTTCLYVVAFGFFGQPFNQYWGSVIAPLFCFGAAYGVASVVDLWRASRLHLAATWSDDDARA
jgi:hypothetical protein